MSSEQIKELMAKVHIFHTVYDIVDLEQPGVLHGKQLNWIGDFDTELQAELFIVQNVGSYHSLTIIKRYE